MSPESLPGPPPPLLAAVPRPPNPPPPPPLVKATMPANSSAGRKYVEMCVCASMYVCVKMCVCMYMRCAGTLSLVAWLKDAQDQAAH